MNETTTTIEEVMNIKKFLDSLKPRCTIYLNWTGPSCEKNAVSRNDYGGFQCEWHSSIKPCASNKPGPYKSIQGNGIVSRLHLQTAYALRLGKKFLEKKRAATPGKVVVGAEHVPMNMKRGN